MVFVIFILVFIFKELQKAAQDVDLERIGELTNLLKEAKEVADYSQGPVKAASVDPDAILPKFPHVFKCATVKGFDSEKKILHLVIEGSNYPVIICGDSCATNPSAQQKMEEKYGIKSLFSNCFSHVASDTIRRTATSETMFDENVKKWYNSLIKVLRYFSKSPKSTEMVNRALSALELNNVHMLVWGGTRMGEFLDGCKQCSDILVPFMDTLVTGNIRSEETLFLLSPMGIFLLQLMADLYLLFMDHYLRKTDTDIVLACETKGIVDKTISNLLGAQTPRCQEVLDSMDAGSHDNIIISAKNDSKRSLQSDINHQSNPRKVHPTLQDAVRENKN